MSLDRTYEYSEGRGPFVWAKPRWLLKKPRRRQNRMAKSCGYGMGATKSGKGKKGGKRGGKKK